MSVKPPDPLGVRVFRWNVTGVRNIPAFMSQHLVINTKQ
jgi:hypothetical protein